MKHQPRKRFGQNFLQDHHIIAQILQAFCPMPEDHVLEIGPGQGALTLPLLSVLNTLTAIEIDRDLQAYLSALPVAKGKLTVINADALQINLNEFGSSLRIIGNLPYNISTPLILHLLTYMDQIKDMHFMLQREVAERIAAAPGNKTYGRLSVMVQYYCETEHLFDVPSSAFFPAPKVESSVIRLTPHNRYPEVRFSELETVVARSFAMRRKTLANNLKGLYSADDLTAMGIAPQQRPEQLSVDKFVQLALNKIAQVPADFSHVIGKKE